MNIDEQGASARSEPPPMVSLDAIATGLGAATRSLDSLGFVMDVPVDLTVEIGRRRLKIADILRLAPGSVLELDKASGEPLDILANGRVIARGEAVVVGDHYGVRLTEVLMLDDARGGDE